MRVLYISKALVFGQYQRKLEEIAKHPDVALRAIAPEHWREGEHRERLQRRYTAGYELVVEPVRFNGHYHLHYFANLRRHMLDWRPDVVHMNGEAFNFATAHAIWHARRAGAKAVFVAWQNNYRVYPPPFYFIELYSMLKSTAAQAGSRQAQEVLRRKRYSHPSVVFTQHSVDAALFAPAAKPQAGGEVFRIGYVGRLVAAKGINVLLSAVARLDFPWRVQLFGTGPEEPALRSQAQDLGIQDLVEFHGHLDIGSMPERYRDMDVCALPSLTTPRWKEQFGRVLIEAMACGVPIVGSDSGEIPNTLGGAGEDRGGLTFPEGDAAALAKRLDTLYREPALRRQLGAQGRQRVLREFSHERIAAKTVLMYRQLTYGPGHGAERQGTA